MMYTARLVFCCLSLAASAYVKRERAVSLRKSFLLASLQAQEDGDCPPPQPCSCWCHCPETLLGEPAPPGAPPIAAVNPYALPPPPPAPLPPPHFVTPAGNPGIPIGPAAALVQTKASKPANSAVYDL